jgi:hypothetical protein
LSPIKTVTNLKDKARRAYALKFARNILPGAVKFGFTFVFCSFSKPDSVSLEVGRRGKVYGLLAHQETLIDE